MSNESKLKKNNFLFWPFRRKTRRERLTLAMRVVRGKKKARKKKNKFGLIESLVVRSIEITADPCPVLLIRTKPKIHSPNFVGILGGRERGRKIER